MKAAQLTGRLCLLMVVVSVVGKAERITSQREVHLPDVERPRVAEDCADHLLAGRNISGMYEIHPFSCTCGRSVQVWCDMDTDGGGWTVFLSRQKQTHQFDFNRTWEEYKKGFGRADEEYWLGNEILYAMTHSRTYSLRLDMTKTTGERDYATREDFRVSSEEDRYWLQVSGASQSSVADRCLSNMHYKREFSTSDRDNDGVNDNCAVRHGGGWWYRWSCVQFNPTATFVNGSLHLNCQYHLANVTRMQMKVRPVICDTSLKTNRLWENSYCYE
ncbi:ryncolin-4-like [Portunus trituberculatus]|uniref:ryncolin-4-like n=1 Tax=Portunus trituberculatus TaxID=210409 RepID=UPI001E1CD579|nr:ryncolin-4-like [Portunus trituberculatus]